MGTALCPAPHNHAEFQSEPHMSYYGVWNGSAYNRPEQNQQKFLLYGFDDSNDLYKHYCYKWTTAVLTKACSLYGRCLNTITCSTYIIHSYSDIMHQRRFLFKRTDHVTHKIPDHFTHLVFVNSDFCGDKKKMNTM